MTQAQVHQAPPGLGNRAFVSLCVVSFLSNFAASPFNVLLPVYVEADVGESPVFAAYLRTLMLALGGVFAIVGGRLCDLFGLKVMLLVGLSGSIAAGLVFQTVEFWILSLLVILAGIAAGPMSTASQSYLISSAGTERLGLGGALFFLSHTLGGSAGSLCAGLLKPWWSFYQIGGAMAATATGVVIVAYLILPEIASTSVTVHRRELSLWSTYRPLLRRTEVQLMVGMRLCITGFWGMATLLMPLMVYHASDSAATAAFFGSVSLAVAAVCQLATGWVRDRFGRSWPLIISALGVAACAVGLGLSTSSLNGLFLFGTGLSATAWAVSVLVPSLIDEIANPEEKNRLVGLGHLAWSTAMATGGIAGGLLIEVDPRLPFFIGAVMALGGAACLFDLTKRLDAASPGRYK